MAAFGQDSPTMMANIERGNTMEGREIERLRARVAELDAERDLAYEREAHAIATVASDESIIANLRTRVTELEAHFQEAKDEADALRGAIKWLWRRCKIVCWPQRWDPPAYPLEHDESARKDSREAIEHEMRLELAALRGEEAP